MAIDGYEDYGSREFCNDVQCPVQLELNNQREGSVEYERTRQICRLDCRHSTWAFHHWLMEKGYLVVRPE